MEFDILINNELDLQGKGYQWKTGTDLAIDTDYWKDFDENILSDQIDIFLEGYDPICEKDGKYYSVMFRVSEHEDGSYWYRPVIWEEVTAK